MWLGWEARPPRQREQEQEDEVPVGERAPRAEQEEAAVTAPSPVPALCRGGKPARFQASEQKPREA